MTALQLLLLLIGIGALVLGVALIFTAPNPFTFVLAGAGLSCIVLALGVTGE